MSAELFEEFRRLRPELPQESAYVFVPVSPPVPDLLFVGQATGGMPYDDDLDYEEAARECISSLIRLTTNPGRVGFWKTIDRISDQVRLIAMRDNAKPTIGWSNLCKVGAAEGNRDAARDQSAGFPLRASTKTGTGARQTESDGVSDQRLCDGRNPLSRCRPR